MANAAAKKAAAAKTATANVYQPLLIGTNLLHIFLLFVLDQQWTALTITCVLVNWGLQVFAYMGILDHATNINTATSLSGSSSRKKDLVGGAHLDLLALTIVIQFGSALHSSKWFGLLWIVPIWAGWLLYSSFFRGAGGNHKETKAASVSSSGMKESDETQDKREKRAQKRKPK